MWRAIEIFILAPLFIVCLSSAQSMQCKRVIEQSCLPYVNYTVGDAGPLAFQTFAPVIQIGCHQEFRKFICTMLYPSCDTPPKVPCRSFCQSVRNSCDPVLNKFGFEFPFNCSMLMEYRYSVRRDGCVLPDSSKTTQVSTTVMPIITVKAPKLKDMRVKERGKLRLVCRLTGRGLVIRWFRNGQLLEPSKRIRIKKTVLKITKADMTDQGVYTCKDQGDHSPDSVYNVTVLPNAQAKPPPSAGMGPVMSNLSALWGYVKKMEQDFEGGVHLHMNGAKATRTGNQIDINLRVKDKKCDTEDDPDREVFAVCSMVPNMPMANSFKANHRVVGKVKLEQMGRNAPVKLDIHLSGFDVSGRSPQHQHGFHVHTYGDLQRGCESTGKHWNPEGVDHGAPTAKIRHHGDLGNIHCDNNGVSTEEIIDHKITLMGPNSIIGRSLIIHEGSDDMGLGGTAASRSSGNAGTKIACCVIALSEKP